MVVLNLICAISPYVILYFVLIIHKHCIITPMESILVNRNTLKKYYNILKMYPKSHCCIQLAFFTKLSITAYFFCTA